MARVVRPLAPWLVEATCAEEEEVVVWLLLLLKDMIRLASRRIGYGCEKVVRRLVGEVVELVAARESTGQQCDLDVVVGCEKVGLKKWWMGDVWKA
jgi:hypothetical protein